jgi:2-oxo-4-hydroxy-4-carboxy--5-ureidoimidazoline (OHCU) decarboxylase
MFLLLLQALSSWLQLRVISAHWELTRKIEKYCDETENAILEARSTGNDALADRLRSRFTRASGITIPSLGSAASADRPDVPSSGK